MCHEVETDDELHEELDRLELIDRVVPVEAVTLRRHFVTDTSGTGHRLPIRHVPRRRAGATDRCAETFPGRAMTVRVGLSAYDITTTELVHLAAAADDAGFESLWLGEHIVLPTDYGSEHPTTGDTAHQHHTGPIVDPSTKLLDPLVALAACASVTSHLRLATGIFILPLRHPLLTARMTLTLQDIAGGRFMLGVGSGWLQEEFDALAVPFGDRAARMDETLAILRRAWSGDVFSHNGQLFSFGSVQLTPEPVHVPLILGGNSERALRRAATAGDGWFSSGTPSFDDAVRLRDRVIELRDATGAHGEFPIYVRVANTDQADLARYDAEGFEHVLVWADQLWPAEGDPDQKRKAFAAAADRLGVEPHRATTDR